MMKRAEYICIGAISGTSMDAIDIAVLKTDGHGQVNFLGCAISHYSAELRNKLLHIASNPSLAVNQRGGELDRQVAVAFTTAIEQCLAKLNLSADAIDLVGFHGQTVLHDPTSKLTCQLGDCQLLASQLGIPVIGDFRLADVKAGGQGAPLAPLYHEVLVARCNLPVAVLNLGGVGNVTFVVQDNLTAFDTGPANALLDDFVQMRCNQAWDEGGNLAARGTPHLDRIANFLANPFFLLPPPKSLDRFHFHGCLDAVQDLNDADGAATLLGFTVASIESALQHLPALPTAWYVTGGGRHNFHLMSLLQKRLNTDVLPIEKIGGRGDSLESEAFAYLAVRSELGLPLSLPTTTGVSAPLTGGKRYQP